MKYKPAYLKSLKNRTLETRIIKLNSIMESCELCPRKCKINRKKNEKGYCGAGRDLVISSYGPHFGEEEPLVGHHHLLISNLLRISPAGGSGTIFLAHCNLLCLYCQNFDISHLARGTVHSTEECAQLMLSLQKNGCHNINFVTPTHFAPQLIESLKIAAQKGLKLPLVWNCGGYENVDIIKLLDGIVDIYMPDFKYSAKEPAKKYSGAPDYFERCKEAVKEMHRQVGDLKMDENGIAYKGLLIRHLVLPNNLAGSKQVLEFITKEVSPETYVNIMSQYRPEGEAHGFVELNRYPTTEEYFKVIKIAKELGLTRGLQKKHLERF